MYMYLYLLPGEVRCDLHSRKNLKEKEEEKEKLIKSNHR